MYLALKSRMPHQRDRRGRGSCFRIGLLLYPTPTFQILLDWIWAVVPGFAIKVFWQACLVRIAIVGRETCVLKKESRPRRERGAGAVDGRNLGSTPGGIRCGWSKRRTASKVVGEVGSFRSVTRNRAHGRWSGRCSASGSASSGHRLRYRVPGTGTDCVTVVHPLATKAATGIARTARNSFFATISNPDKRDKISCALCFRSMCGQLLFESARPTLR